MLYVTQSGFPTLYWPDSIPEDSSGSSCRRVECRNRLKTVAQQIEATRQFGAPSQTTIVFANTCRERWNLKEQIVQTLAAKQKKQFRPALRRFEHKGAPKEAICAVEANLPVAIRLLAPENIDGDVYGFLNSDDGETIELFVAVGDADHYEHLVFDGWSGVFKRKETHEEVLIELALAELRTSDLRAEL